MVQLAAELRAHSRARRQRAVAMARAMNATADVEAQLIRSLADEDHLVRAAAAGALGQCDTLAARESLRRALGDRARWVVEAAGQSLEMLAESDRTRRMPPSTERVDRPSQQPLAPPLIWSVPVEPPLNSWSAAIG
jgi:HEAT repeat protein